MTKQDYNYINNYKNKPYSRYFDYYLKTYSAENVKAYNDIARRPDVCCTPDIVSCSRFNFTTVYLSTAGCYVIDTVSYTHRIFPEEFEQYETKLKRKEAEQLKPIIQDIAKAKASIMDNTIDYINDNYPEAYDYLIDTVIESINDLFDDSPILYAGRVNVLTEAYMRIMFQHLDLMTKEAAASYNADNDAWSQYMDAIL